MPPDEAASLRRLIREATEVLAAAGVPSPAADATALAEHVLGGDRVELALAPRPPAGFADRYAQVVERRRRREPLQHITGRTYFRHLVLQARPGVFVPRPETEMVAEHAIAAAREVHEQGRDPVVVDLCCGAGPIALAVADEVPGARVLAADIDPAAVALARRNAEQHGLPVQIHTGDVADEQLFAAHDRQVDVLAANPPYIPPGARPRQVEVREHDPTAALYGGGTDGLQVPRLVVTAARRLLRPGGTMVIEHAEVQDGAMREIVLDTGAFTDVRTAQDLTGRARMVLARRR